MEKVTTYYHHAAMNEWYMVAESGQGKGFRYRIGQEVYNSNQYFTFDTNEYDFRNDFGSDLKKISLAEYLEALEGYLNWVKLALEGINKLKAE